MLELARAIIRVSIDRSAIKTETVRAKREVQKGFGAMIIRPKIDTRALVNQARVAGSAAGRAAGQSFAAAFQQQLRISQVIFGGGPVGPGQRRIGTTAPGPAWIRERQRRIGTSAGVRRGGGNALGHDPFVMAGGPRPLGLPGPGTRAGQNVFIRGRGSELRGGSPVFTPWRMPPGEGGGGGGRGGRGGGGGRRPRPNFFMRSAQIAGGILGYQAAIRAMMLPVDAIRVAREFESQMARAKIATEGTAEQMARMREEALRLGKSSLFSPTEVASGARILGEKGLSADQTTQMLGTVLNFAAGSGGKINMEEAADVLMGIMNSMQLEMSEVTNVSDILTRSALKSSTNVHELGEAFKYLGPLAKLAGMSLEDAATAVSLLSKNMLGGSIGGTGLKRLVTELQDPKRVGKLEAALGGVIQTIGPDGRLRKLDDIIEDIKKLASRNGIQNLGSIVTQIFGQRSGPQFAALINEGADAFRNFREELRDTSITSASAAGAAMETLDGKIRKLQGSFESLGITLEKTFHTSIVSLIDDLTDLTQNIESATLAWAAFFDQLDNDEAMKNFRDMPVIHELRKFLINTGLWKDRNAPKGGIPVFRDMKGGAEVDPGRGIARPGAGAGGIGGGAGGAGAGIGGGMGGGIGGGAGPRGIGGGAGGAGGARGGFGGGGGVGGGGGGAPGRPGAGQTSSQITEEYRALVAQIEAMDLPPGLSGKRFRLLDEIKGERIDIARDRRLSPHEKSQRVARLNARLKSLLRGLQNDQRAAPGDPADEIPGREAPDAPPEAPGGFARGAQGGGRLPPGGVGGMGGGIGGRAGAHGIGGFGQNMGRGVGGGPIETGPLGSRGKRGRGRSGPDFVGIEDLWREIQSQLGNREDQVLKDNLAANKKTADNTEKLVQLIGDGITGTFA